MRVNETAILRHRTDPVGIAIGGKASMAVVADNRLLKKRNVRLDRLGVDSWEKRVKLLPDGNVPDAALLKYFAQHAAAGTVHRIHCKIKFRFGNQV